MKTISVKSLRPVKMTAKTLIFEDSYHEVYMATRRVANDILTGAVDEVFVTDRILPMRRPHDEPHPARMLATPSCW